MPAAIITTGLTKHFGTVAALDGVDLRVEAGEIYGLIGRNGSGKTTAIRLLLGMLRPSAGRAEVLGERVASGRSARWRRVGYLVEPATAYPDLTVRENLAVACWLYGLRDPVAADRAIEQFGLGPLAGRPARALSSGNLQRLALARALMHGPELVILDEPMTALDPAGVVEVRELIRSLARERGTTFFMSSHILSEVDRNATRIGIVQDGRLIAELSHEELDRQRHRRLEVAARDPALVEELLRRAGFEPRRASDGGPVLVFEIDDPRAVERPDEIARLLVAGGAPPMRLAVVSDDIERVFLALTRNAS